jgi:hypothetical protein
MTNEAENKESSSAGDVYRQFQTAYEDYFQDLQKAWFEVHRRFQKLYTDHEQAAGQAWLNRDKAAFDAELEKHNKEYEVACNASNPAKEYAEAYARYKAATQKAMVGVNELDPMMLQQVGQSLYIVSSWAQMLSCCGPGIDAATAG